MVDWAEFREGVSETRGYLLSHHEPHEWYRCYRPVVLGRRVRLCARCSGIYPGITAGLLASLSVPPSPASIVLVATLPLPALGGRRHRSAVVASSGITSWCHNREPWLSGHASERTAVECEGPGATADRGRRGSVVDRADPRAQISSSISSSS